jgi:hypothetical protein
MADQLTLVGLYYNPIAGAVSNRLVNVPEQWPGPLIVWNVNEWDIKS